MKSSPFPQQNQAFGFLCQQTNTFYAFQTMEQYEAFMNWLKAEQGLDERMIASAVPNTNDQLMDYELATQQIMRVFNDPYFMSQENQINMQEVDF